MGALGAVGKSVAVPGEHDAKWHQDGAATLGAYVAVGFGWLMYVGLKGTSPSAPFLGGSC